ncbi:MAG: thiol reductant ABC exporter subunit CydD [Devosia nanyangense]|uniref:Thiol reductant ABC exporter subunit CydD n=1 Tax=Devosia nanyangense TaxID=1228055 RepID=A0A933L6S8_9HYPH|nr:thiol reductant ABC exporter subunit CydD [Devosia nanyangense]
MIPTSDRISPAPDTAVRERLRRLSRDGGFVARLALAVPLVSGALLLVQAGLLARILHSAIVGGLGVASLSGAFAWLGGVIVLRIAIATAGEVLAAWAGETVKLNLRRALVTTLLGRPPVWTAARSSGALSGLVVEQVEALDGYLTRYLPAMVQAAVLPLAFAVVIMPIDWVVALLFLVTAPLIPVFMALAGWGAEAASRRQADALSRLSGYFADRLRGLTTLKLFNREAVETEGVTAASEELRRRTMRVMRIAFLSSAVLEFFAALGVAGVALYVGLTFLDLVSLRGTTLTLEAGLFCLLMAPEVYQPLRLLAANYHDRANAMAALTEIAAQIGEVPSPVSSAAVRPVVSSARRSGPAGLRLADIAVSTPGGRDVITGIDLDIRAGDHLAILGPSGGGKSTLLEALAGLREYRGQISLDGVELAQMDGGLLRHRVAVLGQRPSIFSGSIADNIRLGRRTACHAALRVAAQRARVTDFADDLPLGLDTPLGENGLGLSGGEIHRVALARLYLRDPGLLLLDEPTAHLDPATEDAVLEGLLEFAVGRTLVIATHSPRVAARMQRCFRIAAGRLLPAPVPAARKPAERGAA